jgi:hypothetical protein
VHGAAQFSHSTRQGRARDKKKRNVRYVRATEVGRRLKGCFIIRTSCSGSALLVLGLVWLAWATCESSDGLRLPWPLSLVWVLEPPSRCWCCAWHAWHLLARDGLAWTVPRAVAGQRTAVVSKRYAPRHEGVEVRRESLLLAVQYCTTPSTLLSFLKYCSSFTHSQWPQPYTMDLPIPLPLV